MLVARELLNLVRSMVDQFSQWGRDAVPEATVQAQYIAILCMLRSVGHVLEKVDCTSPTERQFLHRRWNIWKTEKILSTFIEPGRNELLKEFQNRLQLNGDDISKAIYGGPNVTVAVNFEPEKLRDTNGRLILPLFRESITFWDRCLREIEGKHVSGQPS